jgi:hypothetical protein
MSQSSSLSDDPVAAGAQHRRDRLAVALVHLAAVGLDVDPVHRSSTDWPASLAALQRECGGSRPVRRPVGLGRGPRLASAREKLDAEGPARGHGDLRGGPRGRGDRADVLVTISGDLGATGHIPQIIELVAPRYDAQRHGPATGLNLMQAYLAVRDADAAQHVLDILFSLNRPELEERLHGFSNAVAELINQGAWPASRPATPRRRPTMSGVALVTISRPVWSYGLEAFEEILPKKEGKLRRVAFTQLSLPGAYPTSRPAMREPEDELGRLSRAIPLWFAETFYFSPLYSPIAALACITRRTEPAPGDLPGGLDRRQPEEAGRDDRGRPRLHLHGLAPPRGGELVLLLRGLGGEEAARAQADHGPLDGGDGRRRAQEAPRVHPRLHGMGPLPEGSGIPYARRPSPTAWLDALGALLGLFLVEKKLLPKDQLPALSSPIFDAFAPHAFSPPASSLAWISLRSRATSLGLQPSLAEVLLSRHPAVVRARKLIDS